MGTKKNRPGRKRKNAVNIPLNTTITTQELSDKIEGEIEQTGSSKVEIINKRLKRDYENNPTPDPGNRTKSRKQK